MTNPYPDKFDGDPRSEPVGEAAAIDSAGRMRPSVAGRDGGAQPWLVGGGAVALGLVAFLWLASHRPKPPHDLTATEALGGSASMVASPPLAPPEVTAMEAAGRGLAAASPPPAPPAEPMVQPPPSPLPAQVPALAAPPARSPVLVVDLAEGSGPGAGAPTATGSSGQAAGKGSTTADGPATSGGLNGDEQFAARVEGQEPARSRATVLRGKSLVVAQGATIPGVLETALNSDLPGFARAVVSRDVRSFDGSTVLIPRGSRLIGEYRSAVAQGQSRAFVIWTRVLRSDGVSIQIGSPATDPLGRAGLSGSVDRHFLEEFSGAILLSVINAGSAALVGQPSTEVVIGSSQAATGLAATVSAFAPTVIPPTIKVPQGTPVRIFVARDLDFSSVQGHAP